MEELVIRKPGDLSILCVTKVEPFAAPFLREMASLSHQLDADLIVGVDGDWRTIDRLFALKLDGRHNLAVPVASQGYIESVHDSLLPYCRTKYVLRLDDDERASPTMVRWLANGEYLAESHWKFPRAHLWINDQRYIVNSPLWPDHQTRLSLRELAGGRNAIHCGSPHGGGAEAPCCIEHHKFLIKSKEERLAIVRRYDSISPGAGSCMLAFSVPEDHYQGGIVSAPYTDGAYDNERAEDKW